MAENFDLVIIGGGGSGLSAAWNALEGGVKNIAIIEAMKKTGGNTAMAGGFIYALDTPQLEGCGLNNSVEELKAALDFHHYDYIEPYVIQRWLNETKNTIAWLESRGFKFIISELGEGYTHIMHDSPGVAWFHRVLRPLAEELEQRGVKFYTSTTVTKVLQNADGSVAGVLAKTAEGNDMELKSKFVLLACGGFLSNKEMLKQYFPQYFTEQSFYMVIPSVSNGIELAKGVGAKLNSECTLLKESGMCFKPAPGVPGRIFGTISAVLVNKLGRRFVDESLWNQNYSANGLLHQPGKVGYVIFSKETLETAMNSKHPVNMAMEKDKYFEYIAKASEEGIECKYADTIEELARWIGAKPEVLQDTIKRYNSYCETGVDLDFVKDKKYLYPLLSGPYLAVRMIPMYIDTIGPVVINKDMQVIAENNEPIPGFYAAGVIAAGWEGRDYMRFGSALSFSMTSGRIAGMSIAESLTQSKQHGNG